MENCLLKRDDSITENPKAVYGREKLNLRGKLLSLNKVFREGDGNDVERASNSRCFHVILKMEDSSEIQ